MSRRGPSIDVNLLADTTRDGFWLVDSHGQIKEVNEVWLTWTGWTADQVRNRHIGDFEALETPDLTRLRMTRLRENGSDLFLTRHRRADGGWIDIEASVRWTARGGGRFVCFFREASERLRLEADLRASEARAGALCKLLPDMVFRLDQKGCFLDAKAGDGEFYQPPESFLGRSYREVLPGPTVQAIDQAWKALQTHGQTVRFTYSLQLPEAGLRQFEAALVPGPDWDVLASVRDVTESFELAAQGRQARQLLTDLLCAPVPRWFRAWRDSQGHWTWEQTPTGGAGLVEVGDLERLLKGPPGPRQEDLLRQPGDRAAEWLRVEALGVEQPDGRVQWTGLVQDLSLLLALQRNFTCPDPLA